VIPPEREELMAASQHLSLNTCLIAVGLWEVLVVLGFELRVLWIIYRNEMQSEAGRS
jgi:hypothetical protein